MSAKRIYTINKLPKDKTDWNRVSNLSEKESNEAALADPDAQPLTKKQLAKFKRVHPPKEVNVKEIRTVLHLSQDVFDVKLDPEEQEMLESVERGEWKHVDNPEEVLAFTKEAAANHFSKYAQVNIRISNSDLERIKMLAAEEGLPYQTYITSILHKLSTGRIKDAHV